MVKDGMVKDRMVKDGMVKDGMVKASNDCYYIHNLKNVS